jgi:hypothetical protein
LGVVSGCLKRSVGTGGMIRVGMQDWCAAECDPAVVERYRAKLVVVPGSECLWWKGAISGGGHGRFYIRDGLVVIAHRFAYALEVGVAALRAAPTLAHRCDNPLCQRVGPEHVVASTPTRNRREWAERRHIAGLPLSDPRGPRGRAESLRNLLRVDPQQVLTDLAAILQHTGEQRPLF